MGYQAEIQVLQKNIRRLEEHLKKVNKELYSAELAYDEAKTKMEELEQSITKNKMHFKVGLCLSTSFMALVSCDFSWCADLIG